MLLTYPTGNYRSLLKNIRDIFTSIFIDLPSIKLKRLFFHQQSIEGLGIEYATHDKFVQQRPYATYSIESIEVDRIQNPALHTLRVLYALKARYSLRQLENAGFFISRLSDDMPLSTVNQLLRVQVNLQLFSNAWSEAYELARYLHTVLVPEKPFTIRNVPFDICFEANDLDFTDDYQKELLRKHATMLLTDEASKRQLLCYTSHRWVQLKLTGEVRIDSFNVPFENGQDVYYTTTASFEFYLPEPVAVFLPDREMNFIVLENFESNTKVQEDNQDDKIVVVFTSQNVPVTAYISDNYSEHAQPFIPALPYISTTEFENQFDYPMHLTAKFYTDDNLSNYISNLLNTSKSEADHQIDLLIDYLQNIKAGHYEKPDKLKIVPLVIDAKTFKKQDIANTDYLQITDFKKQGNECKLEMTFHKPTIFCFTTEH